MLFRRIKQQGSVHQVLHNMAGNSLNAVQLVQICTAEQQRTNSTPVKNLR